MKKVFSDIRSGVIQGVISLVILWTWVSLYAAIGSSWTSPSSYEATSTTTLSSTSWNNVLADVANLDARSVPTGAVMAFYGTVCPSWWSAADGSTTVKKTDGSSSTLDLRGEFIRGLDSAGVGARWVDSGRGLGSWQNPTLIAHEIGNANITYTWDVSSSYIGQIGGELPTLNGYTSSSTPNVSLNQSAHLATYAYPVPWYTPDGMGMSVRPRNVALLYCVKN